jgi:hypothetical protein
LLIGAEADIGQTAVKASFVRSADRDRKRGEGLLPAQTDHVKGGGLRICSISWSGKNGPKRPVIASGENNRLTALLIVLISSGYPFITPDLFEDQFRHNNFPISAFHQMMKTLIGILFAPVYDSRDLAKDKFRANWWRECF